MADITTVVQRFLAGLSELPDEGGHEAVGTILQPALEAERDLRILFAQHPDLPYLDNLHLGLINVFELTARMRRARPRPLNGLELGHRFENGKVYTFPQRYLLPLRPSMRRPHGSSVLVGSLDQFRSNFDIFTQNTLSKIDDWSNMVVAGGSVLACLSPPLLPFSSEGNPANTMLNIFFQSDAYAASDIDIFLWGLTPEQAKTKMEGIYTSIRSAISWPVVCVRKLNTISIHTDYPARPIQIVLRLYRSPAEILAGFDIDGGCCLYDGVCVYINPRALAACIRQVNTIDITRRSPSYEVRLAKYADRGFEIFFPALDRSRLDYNQLYDRNLAAYPKGLARLVVFELMREVPFYYQNIYKAGSLNRFSNKLWCPKPMDFKPVEDCLSKSSYDSSWIRIPYGPNWDAERVIKLVKDIDSRANSPFNPANNGRRLHRHAVSCGNMISCIDFFCLTCPSPRNERERETIAAEASKYFRGPVEFMQSNPGRQMITGSFNPIDVNDWSSEAYSNEVQRDIGYTYIHSVSGPWEFAWPSRQ